MADNVAAKDGNGAIISLASTESGGVHTMRHITSNLEMIGGVAVTMGTGVRAAGTLRVTIATDDSVLVTNAGTFAVQATNLAMIAGVAPTMGTGVRAAGTIRVTIATDDSVIVTNAGTFAVQVTSIAAGTNLIGNVALSGRTSGGLSLHSRISTATDSTNVKASGGQLYWAMVSNTSSSPRYIKFFDSASAPTLGAGTPVLRFLIPPNSSGFQLQVDQGVPFASGIGYTLGADVADAGATAAGANEIIVNLGYR